MAKMANVFGPAADPTTRSNIKAALEANLSKVSGCPDCPRQGGTNAVYPSMPTDSAYVPGPSPTASACDVYQLEALPDAMTWNALAELLATHKDLKGMYFVGWTEK